MRLVALLAVLGTSTAVAQPEPEDPVKIGDFEEGRELAKQGHFAAACEKFTRAYNVDPGTGIEINLADCHEKLGHLAKAWQLYDDTAVRAATDNPARAQMARKRADALSAKLVIVVVKVPDPKAPGLAISVAGVQVVPVAEIRARVEPGVIEVRVTSQTMADFAQSQKAAAGDTITFDVATFTAKPASIQTETQPVRRRSRVYAAYALGGVGIVGLAVGSYLGLRANSDYDKQFAGSTPNCEHSAMGPICNVAGFNAVNDAGSLANEGTIVGAIGVAAVAAGVVVFLTAPRDVVVTPTASEHAAGMSISGRF